MKTLKYLLLLLLIFVIGFSIYIATQENSYTVTRTKVIKAPVQVVYTKVNDYMTWPTWSPWIEQEPDATLTYGEKTSGVGASYAWKGEVLGEGSMETLEEKSPDSIKQRIKFIKPWESESDIFWTFVPVSEGTEVTWGMKGEMNFMMKAAMAFNGGRDKQIGPDYERGLFKLDSVLQADLKKYSVNVNGVTTHGGGYYLYNTTSCKIDELASKMAEMMPKVGMYVEKNNITMAGMPFSLSHQYDEANNAVIFSCAVPVAEKVITDANSGIQTGMLQPFKAVKTTLKGNYENLKAAWDAGYKYMETNNLEGAIGMPALEVYANDPGKFPNPADWITEIYIPIKE